MRRSRIILLIAGLLCLALPALAQFDPQIEIAPEDKPILSDSYLDTVVVVKSAAINDYSMIGIQGGAGFGMMYWNPSKSQTMKFTPYNFGVMYTRYGKMFGYMSYFGFQAGLFYGTEGYKMKPQKQDDGSEILYPMDGITSETEALMTMVELPLLAHCHIDFWKMKIIVNLGLFGGYRLSIHRDGDYVPSKYADTFTDYNKRFDYGIKGGVGFGFVFDPIEIHLQAMYKQSLQSMYKPDYASEYYYRFAYPMNFVFSAGIHYQLTRRTGKTNKQLRQEAYDKVYGTTPVEILDKKNE